MNEAQVRNLARSLPQVDVNAAMESFNEDIALSRVEPKTKDIKDAFPKRYREFEKDGKVQYTVDLPTQKERLAWKEMRTPWRHRAVEKMHKDQARIARVRVRVGNDTREVRADMEGVVARQPGTRPVINWGRGKRMGMIRNGRYVDLSGED